jgi:hypothetical protein
MAADSMKQKILVNVTIFTSILILLKEGSKFKDTGGRG